MIKARAWPVRAMYMLIAAALAIGLLLTAAPAQKVSSANDSDVDAEWTRVDTPTMDGWVLAPESVIVDYHTASAGEVAYAIVMAYDEDCSDSSFTDQDFRLLKSEDYCATWTDLTDALEDLMDVDGGDYIQAILRVATDWEDPEFVAVALVWFDQSANGGSGASFLHVFFSTDGGTTFIDAKEVEDGSVYQNMVSDLVVSPEAGGKRDIVIGGAATSGAGLFRCTVTGDSASAWEDVTDETDYEGWDNQWPSDSSTDDIHSSLVTDIIISPSWTLDKTVLVTTVSVSNLTTYVGVYMQCGSWGTSPGWNAKSSLGIDAVEIKTDDIADINLPLGLATFDARGIAGLLLPEDYNSKNTDDRVLWVWVNYWDSSGKPMCDIMRVEDDSADPVGPMGQIEDGEVWLTNISYHGTIAEGEAMAGVLGKGGYDPRGSVTDLFEDCCEGVQVYRNNGIVNMDICCERWHDACKPPTGVAAMAVTYVGDDKAYAVALLGVPPYEEGAWSVTFDDGDTWNQLSLIDTDVDYLSDVAVSPDCNKTFLVSVNYDDKDGGYCHCDSVWLHAEDLPEAEEYSGQWLRTWCGLLEGDNSGDFPWVGERGLLRLNPEETTGDTVFLVDRQSGNVYMNDLETLACWDPISSTAINHIVDLVAQDADTLFALDASGEVSMFDDDEWQEAVEGEVDYGWTIAVHGDHVLVGGQDGDVSYSDDGGETFTELEKVVDVSGAHVTVAFDSYFDQNDTIYAALANAFEDNGIYLWVIGESEDWFQTNAAPMNYTGLVLDRPSPGNPYTSPDTGGVLYASFYAWWPEDNANCDCCSCPDYDDDYGVCDCWYSGVARCLTPITELCCGVGEAQWDYLTWGLVPWGETTPPYPTEFTMPPQALKICGCLTADSNSKLFAIDDDDYAMCDGQDGAVWTFEDCYAKKAVELESPAEGLVVPADPCSCENVPFTIRWDRLCDACCYEIQFALDEDFTELVTIDMEYMLGTMIDDMVDEYYYGYHCYCPDAPMTPSAWIGSWFTCEFTYYWRVRASQAETCQEIHSWWSEPRSFTVAPSAAAAKIDLVSPVPGATGVATKNVGFSWDLTATADKFDWVLDDNADLSSPIQTKTGLTSRACTYTGTLTHGTTYYWQVTAYNEGAPISVSAVGTFTTAAQGAFCCPQCGLCFDTQAELQAHIDAEHPAQPATPFWVWVIIVIGAVLVIVVIVLIFRTRRV
jgi:hypothetical protein